MKVLNDMDIDAEFEKLEETIDCVPGTVLQRTLLEDGMGWVLGVGCFNAPKVFYGGTTVKECLEKATPKTKLRRATRPDDSRGSEMHQYLSAEREKLEQVYNAILNVWHTEDCYRKYAYNGSGCSCGLKDAQHKLREVIEELEKPPRGVGDVLVR